MAHAAIPTAEQASGFLIVQLPSVALRTFAWELVRSTPVPATTGLDPQVKPPTPALAMEDRIEASALDGHCLYLVGQTMLWYRPYPSADSFSLTTGHYLKKWYVADTPERERLRDRR
jgi:hypothetical protein